MKIELRQIDPITKRKLKKFLGWCYEHEFRLQQVLVIGELLFAEDKQTLHALKSLSMKAFDAMYECHGKKKIR